MTLTRVRNGHCGEPARGHQPPEREPASSTSEAIADGPLARARGADAQLQPRRTVSVR
jgi:hypothetical protein